MPSIDLGSVVGPQGAQGATGPQGPQGPQGEAGPNQVTGTTSTTLTGLLYGNGSVVGTKQIGTDVAPQTQISGIFSATSSYAVGAYVVYNGLLYRCTTAHSGAWNAAHFEQVTIVGELNTRTPVYGKGIQLLENGYLIGGGTAGAFPINQRVNLSYTAGLNTTEKVFDRYRLQNATATINADGVTVTGDNTGYGSHLYQKLPRLEAGTYTLSALVESISGSCRLTAPGNNSVSITGAGIVSETFTFAGSTSVVTFYLLNYLNGTIKVKAFKLELGDTQTLARQVNGNWVLNDPPPNYQQELAKCQRYFQVFRTQSLRPTYGIDFRPPMAADTPTLGSFVKDTVTYYTASAEL